MLAAPFASRAWAAEMQTCHRYYKGTRTELSPVTPPQGAHMITWSAKLVFETGYFAYNTPVYDLTQPGLYVFTHYATPAENWSNTTHMIVGDDPVTLLSAASWLSAFGDGDNGLSKAQLSAKARTSVLNVLCGILHPWARDELLTPNSITSRRVHFLTMGTPNNVVDGHEAVEVQIGGNWVLADLSNNVIFTDGTSRLSADDAVAEIAADTFAYEMLATDGYAFESNGGYDATAWARANLHTAADVRAWHRNIFQAVGMWNGSELWWKLPEGSEDRASWVEGLSTAYKVKSASVWNAAFY